jgi:hypothetical protein
VLKTTDADCIYSIDNASRKLNIFLVARYGNGEFKNVTASWRWPAKARDTCEASMSDSFAIEH